MNAIELRTQDAEHRISRHIYGQFAEHLARCIYDGLWVGPSSEIPNTRGVRNDVIEALKKIRVPNIRWPGGNFVKTYNWKDGVGPIEKRPERPNPDHRGTNHLGTHEFLDFCELIDTEPYLCVNVTGGTPAQMHEWMEYVTFDGPGPMSGWRRENGREEPWDCTLWAIGNENWADMTPEYYAEVYKHFAIAATTPENAPIKRVACGPGGPSYGWTETLMKNAGGFMEGLAFHHYSVPGVWAEKGPSVDFGEADWFLAMYKSVEIEGMIHNHSAIMDRYDPERRVALVMDEWGTWYDPLPGFEPVTHWQANTIRDAVVAGLMLNMFNNNCRRLRMANIAQIINVLQCMIHTEGARMCVTPTYHVFDMYKVHQDATMIPVKSDSELYWHGSRAVPALSTSASRDDDGAIHLTLANLNPDASLDVRCDVDVGELSVVSGAIVHGDMNDHNSFDEPDAVGLKPFDGYQVEDFLRIQLPAGSVVRLTLRHGRKENS